MLTRKRRRKSTQEATNSTTRRPYTTSMASSSSCSTVFPITPFLVCSLLVFCLISPAWSETSRRRGHGPDNRTFPAGWEMQKLRRIREHLKKINKPSVKSIQSVDGDVIDCVQVHQQPAFDHPQLRGLKPEDLPEIPKGHGVSGMDEASFQLWHLSGEACPEGTIPIRRTREEDMLRASSIRRFGRKKGASFVRRAYTGSDHEHAVGYVNGDQYYGAKATINVWAPKVANPCEFSLSQVWMISGSFGDDLNTIEAGWQVSPELYGDSNARFFTYWTTDAYQATGCYNLLCSGFIQTNNRIAIGAAISPTSSYRGGQFDISLMIWKTLNEYLQDPKHGNWWLQFGSGILVGYWPSILFTHLRDHANMVQFGGEIVNSRVDGFHTWTQMGSGHFSREGFEKAAYFRNMQVVDWDNSLLPLSNIKVLADHPNCYDIQGGMNRFWGNYLYYGGPGRNVRCH